MSLEFGIILIGISEISESPLNSNTVQLKYQLQLHNLTLIAQGVLKHHCLNRSLQGVNTNLHDF